MHVLTGWLSVNICMCIAWYNSYIMYVSTIRYIYIWLCVSSVIKDMCFTTGKVQIVLRSSLACKTACSVAGVICSKCIKLPISSKMWQADTQTCRVPWTQPWWMGQRQSKNCKSRYFHWEACESGFERFSSWGGRVHYKAFNEFGYCGGDLKRSSQHAGFRLWCCMPLDSSQWSKWSDWLPEKGKCFSQFGMYDDACLVLEVLKWNVMIG